MVSFDAQVGQPQLVFVLVPFASHVLMSNIKICWYLAAVVKTQVCKHMIQIGDSVNEFHVWGEINVLRYVYIEPFPLIPSALFYSFVEWL